jgi:hypothetical protein
VLKKLLYLILLLALLLPVKVSADTSAEITITATGLVLVGPSGLMLTYISDYEIGVSWINSPETDNTLVRVKFGSPPVDRFDGYLAYYGKEESFIDDSVDLTTISTIYYATWNLSPLGEWELTSTRVSYVSDYEVTINWDIDIDTVESQVRVRFGSPPSLSSGYVVYQGAGDSYSDTSIDVSLSSNLFYRAWAQSDLGVWEEVGMIAEAGFMSQAFLFIGLIIMAGFLTFLARYTGQLLSRLASSLIWLALGIWLLLGDVTNLELTASWTIILAFVFIVMTIVPLTWQISTEIKTQAKGKSWSEWGKRPVEDVLPRDVQVKKAHRERLKAASSHKRYR